MSNIIVPFAPGKLRPLTEAALTRLGARFVQLDYEGSYWRLLCELWEARETVVIVEHDILPWHGALDELAACPGQWCSFTYQINGGVGIHHAFGCTKITAALMEAVPHVWRDTADRRWHTLDAQLCHAALMAGQVPHPHRPAVIHLRDLEP